MLGTVYKLSSVTEKKQRRLNGPQLARKVSEGYLFEDGIMQERDAV